MEVTSSLWVCRKPYKRNRSASPTVSAPSWPAIPNTRSSPPASASPSTAGTVNALKSFCPTPTPSSISKSPVVASANPPQSLPLAVPQKPKDLASRFWLPVVHSLECALTNQETIRVAAQGFSEANPVQDNDKCSAAHICARGSAPLEYA